MTITHVVLPAKYLPGLDYSKMIVDSAETARISMDGKWALIAYYGTTPPENYPEGTYYFGDTIYEYLEENYFMWNPAE
jgi:hypothetical protein